MDLSVSHHAGKNKKSQKRKNDIRFFEDFFYPAA
jgi:hypothetical protein